jgi:hypothetical protein
MTLFRRLEEWSRRWRARPRDYVSSKRVDSMSEVPDDTGRAIFLVGPPAAPKWAVF